MILLYVEEVTATNVAPARFRAWVSPNGEEGTWETRDTFTDSTSTWKCRILALGYGAALVGQLGPLPTSSFERTDYHVVMRTDDAGVSWDSVVPEGELSPVDSEPAFSWDVREIINLGDDVVLALGTFNDDPDDFNFGLLKSTDGGATFTKHRPTPFNDEGSVCGISLGDGVAIVREFNTSSNRVHRTTDYGETWTQVTIPTIGGSSTPQIRTFIQLTGGRILGVGDRNVSSTRRPTVWYSDDDGVNWTAVATPVSGLSATKSYQVDSAIALSEGYAVLAMRGNDSIDTGFRPYRMTADGLTWDIAGTYNDAHTEETTFAAFQITVADDGAVLVAQSGQGASVADTSVEVWRGVRTDADIEWSLVFSDEVPPDLTACLNSFIANIGDVPETVGTLTPGSALACVPSFAPPFCPPECPPAATITFSTPPAVATQAGFAAILPILGLMLGGISVAVSVPAGCGPAFTSEPCDRVEIT